MACGGAMGGLLGPANGLYQFLGDTLGEHGIATLRVSYRRPNDLDACVLDAGAAGEMASARISCSDRSANRCPGTSYRARSNDVE